MNPVREALKRIYDQGDNPNLPIPTNWNHKYYLRKYQRVGVSYILAMSRFILGDGVGSGKTVEYLYAWGVYKDKRSSRLLVVTTKSAVSQWGEEVEKFLPGTLCFEIPPSSEARQIDREHLYDLWFDSEKDTVLILNWNQYVRDWSYLEVNKHRWSSNTWAVLDECQAANNPKSKTYKVTQSLSEILPRIHGATASLINDRVHNAANLFNLILPGIMPLRIFERRYCIYGRKKIPLRTGKGGGRRFISVKDLQGYKNLDDFKEKIDHLYIARKDEELDIERPDVQCVTRRAEITGIHEKIYKLAEQGFFLDNNEEEKFLAGALIQSQIAASSPENFLNSEAFKNLITGQDYDEIQSKNNKISLLMDLLDNELEDQPVIIYSPFASNITHLYKVLHKRSPSIITGAVSSEERLIARTNFQDGKTNIILITNAGGVALNLQRAKHVIFYSLPWVPGVYNQIVGRARRFDSKHKYVGVWNLIMKNTVDELVESTIIKKFGPFDDILHNKALMTESVESIPLEVARLMRRKRIKEG